MPSFTEPQRLAIKTFVLADPTLGPKATAGDYDAIATALSANASPNYTVWKTRVPTDEVMKNGMDWTRVDNLSVGKARIWEWMTMSGTFNPSKENVRAGIDATWVGTAADLAVRAAVYVHCKRLARLWEKILSTGTGSDASPGTVSTTEEGAINAGHIGELLS